MTADKIFRLYGSEGSYSDKYEWTVSCYSSKAQAQKNLDKLRKRTERIELVREKRQEKRNEYDHGTPENDLACKKLDDFEDKYGYESRFYRIEECQFNVEI